MRKEQNMSKQQKQENKSSLSRRAFVKSSLIAGSMMAFPAIISCRSMGGTQGKVATTRRRSPNERINVAQIGCGRIARDMDIAGVMKHPDLARIVAVCDLDSVRLNDARELVERGYAKALGQEQAGSVKTYRNYREMLKDPSIDAVAISTPDHWHALPAIEAALAGKDVYLQKPASLTIAEGRHMADVIKRTGRIFQMGSQQRSDDHWRYACELVRNGYIGKIKTIKIGLPGDPAGGKRDEQPVPQNLDYDMWLGQTPLVYYTEDRVHPQTPDVKKRYGRPGWLRCEQFGAGMITGWGAHHIDIAQWAMGLEHSGPTWVEAKAKFAENGLWDVHGDFYAEAMYPNGALAQISNKNPVGVRFEGEDGWIWVTRKSGSSVTASDPKASSTAPTTKHLDASDPKILQIKLKENDQHLHRSPKQDHHLDWIEAMRTRQPAVAPAEDGHRSCSACLLVHAAMKTGRKLNWDPKKEQFINDSEANKLLRRPQREPYSTATVLKQHNIPVKI
ncbi:MAG TPA: Gfo/Idh/MocA family oxidoreductase [Tepidisphaeraceae bacterium]|jgi:predicted dehydrogenase